MSVSFPLRAVSSCFALACFSVAMLSGLLADRRASDVLAAGLVSLFVGQVIGACAAWVLAKCFSEGVESYQAAHPIPEQVEPPPMYAPPEAKPLAGTGSA